MCLYNTETDKEEEFEYPDNYVRNELKAVWPRDSSLRRWYILITLKPMNIDDEALQDKKRKKQLIIYVIVAVDLVYDQDTEQDSSTFYIVLVHRTVDELEISRSGLEDNLTGDVLIFKAKDTNTFTVFYPDLDEDDEGETPPDQFNVARFTFPAGSDFSQMKRFRLLNNGKYICVWNPIAPSDQVKIQSVRSNSDSDYDSDYSGSEVESEEEEEEEQPNEVVDKKGASEIDNKFDEEDGQISEKSKEAVKRKRQLDDEENKPLIPADVNIQMTNKKAIPVHAEYPVFNTVEVYNDVLEKAYKNTQRISAKEKAREAKPAEKNINDSNKLVTQSQVTEQELHKHDYDCSFDDDVDENTPEEDAFTQKHAPIIEEDEVFILDITKCCVNIDDYLHTMTIVKIILRLGMRNKQRLLRKRLAVSSYEKTSTTYLRVQKGNSFLCYPLG